MARSASLSIWLECLQVLRLEPHVIISNRTPVPLQILQTRLALAAPSDRLAGGASFIGGGAVIPEGGSSFTQAATLRGAGVPLAAAGGPSR